MVYLTVNIEAISAFTSMDKSLVLVYLVVLLALLGVASWFVIRQTFKTRRSESVLNRLRKKLSEGKGTVQEYFELGSLYLNKKLFTQAIQQFQQALRAAEAVTEEEPEAESNLAPIYNAMGYAYFAQEQFDLAIRHYKEALKRKTDYVTAFNNLGHAYERKNLAAQALEAYENALKHDPKNDTAKRRATSLRKRVAIAA
ncbi:MAG: tetratricopeptide repeat protein [Thermosynechococcaceae cyanobacterium]